MGNGSRLATVGLLATLCVPAQIEITPSRWSGRVLLYPTDAAVLETPESRKDLICAVAPEPRDPFQEEPPVKRVESGHPRHVKVLLHFAPQRPRR